MQRQLILLAIAAAAAGCGGAGGDKTAPKAAAFTLSPASYDFLRADIGSTSSPMTFNVISTGGAATGPVTVSLSGADAGQFIISANSCGGVSSLAPGAGCSFQAAFVPASSGVKTATLDVSASPGGSEIAQINGTGVPPAMLLVNPGALDYGGVAHAGGTASTDFTVINMGGGTSGVPTLGITGPDASQFAITGTGCLGPVAGGGNCVITVKFAPTSTGVKNAVLNVIATPGGATGSSLMGTGT